MSRPIVSLHGIAPGDSYEQLVREITNAFSRRDLPAPRHGSFNLTCQAKEIDGRNHAVVVITIDELPDANLIGRSLEQILSSHVMTQPQEYGQINWTTVTITVSGEEKFSSSLPVLPT